MIDIMVPFQGHLPFAVVGSMDELKVGNKMVKARQYPWGVVQGKWDEWWLGICMSPNSLKVAFSIFWGIIYFGLWFVYQECGMCFILANSVEAGRASLFSAWSHTHFVSGVPRHSDGRKHWSGPLNRIWG